MSSTTDSIPRSPRPLQRATVFWPLFAGVIASDIVTKRFAERTLSLHLPHDVIGDWFRLTLTYNTGAAMDLSLGDFSRVVFTVIASCMLVVIFRMYLRAPRHDVAQAAALALIAAGALGNLIDRLRSARGVVDFIDVGHGDWRFWTFNVADVGVTIGAVSLALLFMLRTPAQESPPVQGRPT